MSANAVTDKQEELVMTRVFDAPRERVFDILTKPEHLQKWWGPKGVSHPIVSGSQRCIRRVRLQRRAGRWYEITKRYISLSTSAALTDAALIDDSY